MAIQLIPNNTLSNQFNPQLTPASLGIPYTNQYQPFVGVGGKAPYTYAITAGNLPPGLVLLNSPTQGGQGIINGIPQAADSYLIGPNAQNPIIQNSSTFTVTVTDSLNNRASVVYTIPVFLFSEQEAITIYEMLRAVYASSYYIVLDSMGTRNIKIGDVGSPAYGPVQLLINAYLNAFTQGMVQRMRYYIREFDKVKLIAQVQTNGGVAGVNGISMNWSVKAQRILEMAKTMLPIFTTNETTTRMNAGGGSDSIRSLGGQSPSGGGSVVTLSR